MGAARIKTGASKNQLAIQVKADTMVKTIYEGAVASNTCKCGHWAIRHLGFVGTACREKGCWCMAFEQAGGKAGFWQRFRRVLTFWRKRGNQAPASV